MAHVIIKVQIHGDIDDLDLVKEQAKVALKQLYDKSLKLNSALLQDFYVEPFEPTDVHYGGYYKKRIWVFEYYFQILPKTGTLSQSEKDELDADIFEPDWKFVENWNGLFLIDCLIGYESKYFTKEYVLCAGKTIHFGQDFGW